MNSVKLCIATLFIASGAAAADCTHLNTSEFLEQTPWEQVIECVEANPKAFEQTDSRGYNLLMIAAVSDVHPLNFDDLFTHLPDDLRSELLDGTDLQGRSLAHLVAAEGTHPEDIFVLSANAVNLFPTVDGKLGPKFSGWSPLHFAAERGNDWAFAAALLATGAFSSEDANGVTPLDIALSQKSFGAEALLLANGSWPELFKEQEEEVTPTTEVDCDSMLTSDFFRKAEAAGLVTCLQDKKQLDAVNRDGDTILHLAAEYAEDPWVIDQILAFSDDPKAVLEKRNSAGKTPLHLAAESGTSADILLHLLAWVY